MGVFKECSFKEEQFRTDRAIQYKQSQLSLSNLSLLGNFDVRFPDNPHVTIQIPYIPPLDKFVLSMWIRMNTSLGNDATIFELKSERGTVLKLKRDGLGNDLKFFFPFSNSTKEM